MNPEHRVAQAEIAAELEVVEHFDAAAESEHRVEFLAALLEGAGLSTLVLGISGGVDSAVAGGLCARAVERLRERGTQARFVAVRLPYGRQTDSADVEVVLEALRPDETLSIDVQPASDASLAAVEGAGLDFESAEQRDFVLGNVKARERMVVQYAIAGTLSGLVVGTDQAAEALTGFFTKYGDGGVDVVPLAGLTKRRVRALGAHLGLPERIVDKVPTADLHSLQPQRPDEDELGVSYQQIDDFLEGVEVDPPVVEALVARYRSTAHKRAMPVGPGLVG